MVAGPDPDWGLAITLYSPPGETTIGPIVLAQDGSLWAFGGTTVTRITLS